MMNKQLLLLVLFTGAVVSIGLCIIMFRSVVLVHAVAQRERELADDIRILNSVIADQRKQIDSLQKAVAEKDKQIEQLTIENEDLRTIPALVTAYAPLDPCSVAEFDYSGDPSVTATGTKPMVGVGAADFSKLPAGTVLEVPGYGTVTIEDTGGAMRKYEGVQIDVVFDTRKEALKWGRQNLDVRVVSVPKGEE
jgi:3D (Asp-Asp-Asp) domain-containing protein